MGRHVSKHLKKKRVVVSGDLLGVSTAMARQGYCAIVKYDSIFWVNDTEVKMTQSQRRVGPSIKQFIRPSHHEEAVTQLLAGPVSQVSRFRESGFEADSIPTFQTTASARVNFFEPFRPVESTVRFNEIKKRKRYPHISDDEVCGEGEEVELDPAHFVETRMSSQADSPLVNRAIRQRKKVKFVGARKEQIFHEHMPTESVVRAKFLMDTKDNTASHQAFSRPYVPAGEEIPDFYYSDDSEVFMDALMETIAESSDISRDSSIMDVDSGYKRDDESDSAEQWSDEGSGDVSETDELSEFQVEHIEGIEPPDHTPISERVATVLKGDADLHIDDIPAVRASETECRCPICENYVVQSRMSEHLNSGCDQLFTMEQSNAILTGLREESSDVQIPDTAVQCPVCQKLVIRSDINEHLDAGCDGYLAEDMPQRSDTRPATPRPQIAELVKENPHTAFSKGHRRRLAIDISQPRSRRVTFANDRYENQPFPRSPTPGPSSFRPRTPSPLINESTYVDDTPQKSAKIDGTANFKNYIIPIGHPTNAQEQDPSQGKGKQALRPANPDHVLEAEMLKLCSGNIAKAESKSDSGGAAAVNESSGDSDEADRGRSKLRGGYNSGKRSQARSRGRERFRRERSLSDNY